MISMTWRQIGGEICLFEVAAESREHNGDDSMEDKRVAGRTMDGIINDFGHGCTCYNKKG
jgi:hypothetical protein